MITYNPNLGWNSGARSRLAISGDLVASFAIPNVVGVVVGLNESDLTPDYRELDHAIMFMKKDLAGLQFIVVENGISKTSWTSFAANDKFSIMRVGGVVSYWHGSTKIYTSVTPSNGGVFMDTSLYSAGDKVV